MKTKNLFLLSVLIAGLGLIPAGRMVAQTFTRLHSFTGGSDGANPAAGLILSGNTLYGTAQFGGSSSQGAVFKINTDGTGFTNLHSFTGVSDGASPQGELTLSGNTVYGTAYSGGSSGLRGAVFKVNTDGTGFTNLHSFTGVSDGANPTAGLILAGYTLYGTTFFGNGSDVNGTVFGVNTDGSGFTNLHSFTVVSNGWHLAAGLVLVGNTLYGTATSGGSSLGGTAFAVNTDGTGFTNLHHFTGISDGLGPFAGLILSGDTLYGTTRYGPSSGDGTVFALNTNGTVLTTLHNFTAIDPVTGFNNDGARPVAGLILSGHTLYGTAERGGSSGNGTVFAVNTDGTGFTNLHTFAGSDGASPSARLILSDNTLYGTTYFGGSSDNGTVFSLSLASVSTPQLTIIPSGANVVLTWLTNAVGFTLQSTTNLVSPVIWTTNSPSPVVVNGQNTVTNPISGTQKFYRLSQ